MHYQQSRPDKARVQHAINCPHGLDYDSRTDKSLHIYVSNNYRFVRMFLLVLLLLFLQFVLILLVLLSQFLLVVHLWWLLHLTASMQRRGQKVEHIVIVGQAAGGCRNTKVTILGQLHSIGAQTHFVVIVVVRHAVVDEHGQHIVVVLDAGTRGEWLVTEIPETAAEQLRRTIVGMIVLLGAVVQHGANVGIVVLIVIVERIEDNGKTIPTIGRAKHLTIVVTLLGGVPEGQTIGTDATTSSYTEDNLHIPPIEVSL